MKVLHLFNGTAVSGPEKATIPHLLKLGIDISVLVLEERRINPKYRNVIYKFAQSFGLKSHQIMVRSKFDFVAIYHLRKFIKNNHFTHLHAHDVKATFYLNAATFFLPVKIFSTFHGLVRFNLKDKFYEYVYFISSFLRNSSLIAVSKNQYEKLKLMTFSPRKIFCLPNAISITPHLKSFKQSIDYSKLKRPFGVMMARFSDEKNHQLLFKALSKIDKEMTIFLFGFGPLENELKILAKELNIEDKIYWGGYVNSIEEYLADFDFSILISKTEGISITLLESVLKKKLMLVSDIEGIREVLPQNDMAYYADINKNGSLEEKLVEISNIKDFINHPFVAKAYDHVLTNYTENNWCQNLQKIYGKS